MPLTILMYGVLYGLERMLDYRGVGLVRFHGTYKIEFIAHGLYKG